MTPILDSGERVEFESGAVRDIKEGKGRCDLLPLKEASFLIGPDNVLIHISNFMENGNIYSLKDAFTAFIKKRDEMYCTYTDEPRWVPEMAILELICSSKLPFTMKKVRRSTGNTIGRKAYLLIVISILQ